MQFGLQLHADRGADAVLDEARLADAQGFDSVWTGDHLIGLRGEQRPDRPLETWTLMTAIGGANVFAADSQAAAERTAVEAFEAGKVQFVQNLESLLQNGIIGTPEHVAQRFDEMTEWGVNYLRLTFSDAAQQTYFAERVLPRVEAMSASPASPMADASDRRGSMRQSRGKAAAAAR